MAFCFKRSFTFKPRLIGEVACNLVAAATVFILVEPNLVAAKVAVVRLKAEWTGAWVGLTAAEWPKGGDGELDTDEAGSLMGIKTWASGLKLFLISLSNSHPFHYYHPHKAPSLVPFHQFGRKPQAGQSNTKILWQIAAHHQCPNHSLWMLVQSLQVHFLPYVYTSKPLILCMAFRIPVSFIFLLRSLSSSSPKMLTRLLGSLLYRYEIIKFSATWISSCIAAFATKSGLCFNSPLDTHKSSVCGRETNFTQSAGISRYPSSSSLAP